MCDFPVASISNLTTSNESRSELCLAVQKTGRKKEFEKRCTLPEDTSGTLQGVKQPGEHVGLRALSLGLRSIGAPPSAIHLPNLILA